MFRKSLYWGLATCFAAVLTASTLMKPKVEAPAKWNEQSSLAEALVHLGYQPRNVKPAALDEKKIKMGEELITQGWTTGPDGKKTKVQSRYYICTNCHNLKREDPDTRLSDPDKRLEWCAKQGIPLLQGTTFYGQVNRESWYNDDYEKKYGDLVKPARESMDAAIHLCATVCSQGRDFNEWEMEAVRAYLWSIEMKLGDLPLAAADYEKLNAAKAGDKATGEWLRGYYLNYSPATFVNGPENHKDGFPGLKGDANRGKLVYDMACLACHNADGPSEYLKLDHSVLSLNLLKDNIAKYNRFSIYEIIRHGTHPFAGHKPYMPHYTAQRMSDQQIEDLRAYLES